MVPFKCSALMLSALILVSLLTLFTTEHEFRDLDRYSGGLNIPKLIKVPRMIYITHSEDEYQTSRVGMLSRIFGDQLYIVWGGDSEGPRHFEGLNVISNYPITSTNRFGAFNWVVPGTGVEQAMMWLIDHRKEAEYTWVMESDVWFESETYFKEFVWKWKDSNMDLLHQNYRSIPDSDSLTYETDFEEMKILHRVRHFKMLRPPFVDSNAAIFSPYFEGLFNFYRISSSLVGKLDSWRIQNNGNWIFMEPLVASFAVQQGFTTKSYLTDEIKMRYRPCFTQAESLKILHPVKGNFTPCEIPRRKHNKPS